MGLSAAESNGRSQATETLYREHGPAVATLCRSLLRDRAEAEDATQQVFLSAHRALLGGTTPREPLAWLLTVARHECYARWRERAAAPVPTRDPPEGAATDASALVLRAGDLASVWDEVGQMPPAQREAFLLREIRGLSYGQLADELALSPPSVRSLLLRARARLRRRLRDVAALGGVPWLQGFLRLGADGTSPLPAATKAAAVGLGALALVGGGDVPRPVHHASPAPVRATASPRTSGHGRHHSAPAAALAPRTARRSEPEHATTHDDSSGTSRSDVSDRSGSSGSSESGHDDRSGGTTAAPVTQPTTDGRDGGGSGSSSGSSSSGPGPGTTSSDGGPEPSSGSGSGSDGGSGSVTTTTSSGSSDGSGSDGGSGSHDGGSTGGHGG